MKGKATKISLVMMILFIIIGAGVVTASIEIADTGLYDKINGKKLLFYGNTTIKDIEIKWWNTDVPTESKTYTAEDIGVYSYFFTIGSRDTWNATYIQWSADIWDPYGNSYRFEGGFPTAHIEPIDYDKLQNKLDVLKANIIVSLINSSAYWGKFSNNTEGVVKSVTNYFDTISDDLKNAGFSDDEIRQLSKEVESAVELTREQEADHRVEIIKAEDKGWNNCLNLVKFVLGTIILIIFVWFLIRSGIITRFRGVSTRKLVKNKRGRQSSNASTTLFGV